MLHRFEKSGRYVVYDNVSGVLFEVDKVAFELLEYIREESVEQLTDRFGDQYGRSNVKETAEELRLLIEEKLLFDGEPEYEQKEAFGKVKALCLNVSHDCDLRCAYCFAAQGSFKKDRQLMSLDTAKAAIDFLIKESGNRQSLEVDFFGGEPLLNFDVVKQTVLYARKAAAENDKTFKFTLTTNAYALDKEKEAFLNEYMDNVVLSLDGRRMVHDRMRPATDGTGSYIDVCQNILSLIKNRGEKEYYVRGTYTAYNKDFAEDVLHIANMGVEHISVEPVSAQEDLPYALQKEDLTLLDEQYDRIMQEYLSRLHTDRPFQFFHFNVDIDNSPCVYKKISGCGAGSAYLAVAANGELYPCHQLANEEKFLLGNVFDGLENEELGREFFETNILTKEDCRDCWAKYHCGGGCYAAAYYAQGDISLVDEMACEIQKKRLEYALLLKVVNSDVDELYPKDL